MMYRLPLPLNTKWVSHSALTFLCWLDVPFCHGYFAAKCLSGVVVDIMQVRHGTMGEFDGDHGSLPAGGVELLHVLLRR